MMVYQISAAMSVASKRAERRCLALIVQLLLLLFIYFSDHGILIF
jgi:hypothetical protein